MVPIFMVELTFVRHGQASFGSEDYDQLSDLGLQQSQWLGEYFNARGTIFDRVIIGSQQRHQQTAKAVMANANKIPDFEIHDGFNEYDFRTLFQRFCEQYPQDFKDGDRRAFFTVLRKALTAWHNETLEGELPEKWLDFDQRISQALAFACNQPQTDKKQRVLIITSGGPISMVMKQVLDLTAEKMINLNLQVINTSSSRVLKTRNRMHLQNFNSIVHLDDPTRLNSITYS